MLQVKLADPNVAGDPDEYQKTAKAAAELQDSVEAYRQTKSVLEDLQQAKAMLKDSAGGPCCPHVHSLCLINCILRFPLLFWNQASASNEDVEKQGTCHMWK